MNVFINCPLDARYARLLRVLSFVLLRYGFNPRLAIEDPDTNRPRLEKITKLIAESDLSIHDLSRMKSKARAEYARMNMPFELGIDYGRKLALGTSKPILILEEEKYSFQKGLSDYSAFDILCHRGNVQTLVKVLRDWFVANRLVKDLTAPSAIWYEYNDFRAFLYDQLKTRGYAETATHGAPFNEYADLCRVWVDDVRPPNLS